MTRPLWTWAMPLLALAGCSAELPVDSNQPDAYAVRLPVEPAAGGGVQRLTLPAGALVAVRRDDLGDIRLFDGRGRRVAMALADISAPADRRSEAVALFPVVGSLGESGDTGVSIRIEDGSVARVVTVDTRGNADDAASGAVLIDTRGIRRPVQAIRLDATVPEGRPVTLTLQSSANLRDWQPLAEATLFRPEGAATPLGDGRIALEGADLAGRYVAIRWPASAAVTVRRAEVESSTMARPAAVEVATGPLVLETPHTLTFTLPPTAPLRALRLVERGNDGVLPLRLFGRANAEQRWTPLSAGTLRPGEQGVLLGGMTADLRQYRIEADQRTGGFSAPPTLTLLIEPVTVVADVSGTPPYQLAVGQGEATPAWLEAGALLPAGVAGPAALPEARVQASGQPPPTIALAEAASDGPLAPRKLALWGALLFGTLLLGFIAWRLVKGLPPRTDGAA